MEASQATALRAGPLAPVWRVLGDEQLARAAADGNDHAFAALYARYRPVLKAYCASIVLDAADAEDAVQGAMLKAMRALPRRDPKLPLRPWLYRIAHNESVDLLRRRRPQASPDALDAVFVPGPEVDLVRRERLSELVSDLRALPERQGAALVMRELSGLTYDEIGQALQLTPHSARQAVFEARSALNDFERGRDATCSAIQRTLSDDDRRRWRTRSIRAHLRACRDCRSFEHSIARRGEDLALLPPFVLNGAATVALAGGLLGGMVGTAGGGAATSSGVGMLAGLAGGSAAKSLAGAAAAVAVGGAALGGAIGPGEGGGRRPAPAPRAIVRQAPPQSAVATPTPVALRRYVAATSRGSRGSGGAMRTRSRTGADPQMSVIRVPALDVARKPVEAVTKTVSDVSKTVRRPVQAVQEQAQRAPQQAGDQARRAAEQAKTIYADAMARAAEATRQAVQIAQTWQQVAAQAAAAYPTSITTTRPAWQSGQQSLTEAQQTVSTTMAGVQQLFERLSPSR